MTRTILSLVLALSAMGCAADGTETLASFDDDLAAPRIRAAADQAAFAADAGYDRVAWDPTADRRTADDGERDPSDDESASDGREQSQDESQDESRDDERPDEGADERPDEGADPRDELPEDEPDLEEQPGDDERWQDDPENLLFSGVWLGPADCDDAGFEIELVLDQNMEAVSGVLNIGADSRPVHGLADYDALELMEGDGHDEALGGIELTAWAEGNALQVEIRDHDRICNAVLDRAGE